MHLAAELSCRPRSDYSHVFTGIYTKQLSSLLILEVPVSLLFQTGDQVDMFTEMIPTILPTADDFDTRLHTQKDPDTLPSS
jgi:hypothetical protein